jgi:hypothetical protein
MSDHTAPASRQPINGGGDHKVGYGKPPVEHRFKKGKSGNPGGRPKIAKPDGDNGIAVFSDAAEIFNEKMEVSERGRTKTVPLRKVIVRRYIKAAVQSDDPKVLDGLLKFMEKVDRAVHEGRGQEALKIIVEGGLPDDPADQFPPPAAADHNK